MEVACVLQHMGQGQQHSCASRHSGLVGRRGAEEELGQSVRACVAKFTVLPLKSS